MEVTVVTGLSAIAGAFLGFLVAYIIVKRRMETEVEHVR